tara:strand:+ start:1535 stop:1879 length:345 start_codon:yes stop_codon:yes gene_type:complete
VLRVCSFGWFGESGIRGLGIGGFAQVARRFYYEMSGRRSGIMLVITRREGEEIVIGDPANPLGIVRIASIKGDRVRIALDFPRDVPVHRSEIASQIAAEGPSIAGKIRPASNDS